MTEELRPAWAAPWVGLPYASKGRGPDRWDCYGLVRGVTRARWGVELPMYLDGYDRAEDAREVARVVSAAMPDWRDVGAQGAREGDVALLRTTDGNPSHVGLLVGQGWLLHMLPKWHSVCERRDGPVMAPRILGVFRHPVMEDACPRSSFPTPPGS
jgi:cell wall-associated NlpC family hydrolase